MVLRWTKSVPICTVPDIIRLFFTEPLARCVTDHPSFCFLLKFDFLELTSNWFVVVALQYIAVRVTLRPCTSSWAFCGYILILAAKCTVFCSEVLHIDWRVSEGTQVCCSFYCIYLHSVCCIVCEYSTVSEQWIGRCVEWAQYVRGGAEENQETLQPW